MANTNKNELAIVREFPSYIQYMRQTPELCAEAIKRDPNALQFVKKPSKKLCKLAIKANREQMEGIKNRYGEFDGYFEMVEKSSPLQYVREPDEAIIRYAVKNNYSAIQFVKNPSKELCLYAINDNYRALKFIAQQSFDICITALDQSPDAIEYIIDQTTCLCHKALRRDPRTIKCIKNKTLELCKPILREYKKYYKYSGPYIVDNIIYLTSKTMLLKAIKEDTDLFICVLDEYNTILEEIPSIINKYFSDIYIKDFYSKNGFLINSVVEKLKCIYKYSYIKDKHIFINAGCVCEDIVIESLIRQPELIKYVNNPSKDLLEVTQIKLDDNNSSNKFQSLSMSM